MVLPGTLKYRRNAEIAFSPNHNSVQILEENHLFKWKIKKLQDKCKFLSQKHPPTGLSQKWPIESSKKRFLNRDISKAPFQILGPAAPCHPNSLKMRRNSRKIADILFAGALECRRNAEILLPGALEYNKNAEVLHPGAL